MKTLLNYLVAVILQINPVFASLTALSVSLLAVFSWINTQWAILMAKMDALVMTNFGGTINLSPFALTNTFMPLTEALTYFTAWLAVLTLATVIRVIKSFIPAVAT